ncbi:hypothetical protein JG687_00017287 [Phytophthora cactorum]|uniref:Uncharacterized protein n=1 Tax=Phytophthora cactorum TaxID=29920 RepID=A0A329R7U3_9STRA|nr:hypothetical protein PC114_g21474 [Phytophthora cactorum]KAG2891657.1 hypothetical protein PC115_g19109 [Phytophthora cactorum]KAG2903271.1 hypothetical protein PC117_g21280 [Phytophthora cactorum]KAG2966194.1 hypothetical protein PC118_g19314 [Phytophthora cactorum]KAG3006986.1 hypothetical protein PC120_g17045 [Phytophthora cactorum]
MEAIKALFLHVWQASSLNIGQMNDLRLPARPLTLGRPPQVKPVIEKIGCCITKCL